MEQIPDLRLLRNFSSVYRLGSFSKAADELCLSHSAVTKSIQALEIAWNTKLFLRTTRSVVPTEAGKRLHPLAIDLLNHAQYVRRQTVSGASELKIIAGPGSLETLVQPAILKFRELWPHTRIIAETLPPAYAVEELMQRRAQLLVYHEATILGLPHQSSLELAPLVSEPYVIVLGAGHPALHGDWSIKSLMQYDWAVAGYDEVFSAGLPASLREFLHSHSFPRYQLSSQSSCLRLVTSSDVITTVPRSAADLYCSSENVEIRRFPGEFSYRAAAAMLAENSGEESLSALVESMQIQ